MAAKAENTRCLPKISEDAWKNLVMSVAIAALAVLILARLGHYALWDDEAITALGAKAVHLTGDTSVLVDHSNVVGYREGVNITNFADRLDPPLPSYVTAASFAFFGMDAWSARLPFALSGLITCGLLLWWARSGSALMLAVVALGLIGNVPLILYARQCRYYGLAIFITVAMAYIYCRWKPAASTFLILSVLSVYLFGASCLTYAALYACFSVDYLVWKRKEWPFRWRSALLLFGPQVVLNGLIFSVWNPFRTKFGGYEAMNGIWERLTLGWWYWRDANQGEFFALPVLLLALIVGIVQRRTWLVRGCVVLAVYVLFITVGSPQPVKITSVADVRYVSAVIPLAIALEAGAICVLLGRLPWLAIGAAVVVFGTNIFNGGPLLDRGFHSTICDYVGELLHPVPEPYTPTADWINANVPDGESVWVLPDYSTYPLMFHAPRALYAWQLDWPPRADFAQLPAIHFKGQVPPDFLVAFGPYAGQMVQALQSWNRPDVRYQQVATLPVFWHDMYRPELFWRSFTPITGFDPNSQAIYIFKRTSPPIAAPAKP